MKIRSGFVSNSSSSSFIVSLAKITARDLKRILKYEEEISEADSGYRDQWSFSVDIDKEILHGFTTMDNGQLDEYLQKHGVNTKNFKYENY